VKFLPEQDFIKIPLLQLETYQIQCKKCFS
jgi:hypothetical protein